METIILALKVLQTMGISLGVGASTLAIVFFFLAIKDGEISRDERSYLGVIYIVLRVAMGIILVTTLLLATIGYVYIGLSYFTGYATAQLILLAVLFTNAFLMTKRIMPSTFGPAIQASSWYSLGFLAALYGQDVREVDIMIFFLSYITLILFATSFINAMMAYLKEKREESVTN